MSCMADLDWVCGEETMDASGARKGTMASLFSALVTPRNAPEPTDSLTLCENNSILEESRSPEMSEPMESILHAQHQGVVNGPCNTPQAILVSTDRFNFNETPKNSSKGTPKNKRVVLPAPPTPTHKDSSKMDPPTSPDAGRDAVPMDSNTTPNEDSDDIIPDEHGEIVESPSASSDHRTRTLERVKELRQLRSRNLAKRNAEKLQQCSVPENAATFLEKQREQSQDQRQKEKDAKDSLHSYRSSDQELLEGFRRTMSKDSNASRQEIQMSYSSPAYCGMNEVDEFYLYQKEVSEWRGQRARSFEENAIASSMDDETVVLFERSTTGHVRETAASMEEKWSLEETKTSATFASNVDSEVAGSGAPYEILSDFPTDDCPSEPEPVVDDENSEIVSDNDSSLKEEGANDNPETVESKDVEDHSSVEKEEQVTDLAVAVTEEPLMEDANAPKSSLDTVPAAIIEPEPETSDSATPQFVDTRPSSPRKAPKSLLSAPTVHMGTGTSPSMDMAEVDKSRSNRSMLTITSVPSSGPALKQVPLYSRRPLQSTQDRSVATSNSAAPVLVCSSRYIPNLHSSRDGCERCLYWASEEEKTKFAAEGHHLRIMKVRGGCGRNCTLFPRNEDEYPVRLCKKCFFDTHRKPDATMEEGFKN